MFRHHLFMVTFLVVNATNATYAADVYDSPEAAKADPDFQRQGEYKKDGSGIQVVAQGEGNFTVVIYTGGLPGDGWNGRDKQNIEANADDVADLTEGYQRIERQSPTIGAAPPEGAVVLFDGTQISVDEHWEKGARLTDDGLLMEGITSKDKFQDFRIHAEFRTPFMPKARGQGRGNSGLYYQGRYETQILDSFGLEGKDNETGGIYEIQSPNLNMCFPPLTWQTYDAEFKAARFENGEKVSNATLTVRLNGVTVHSSVELPRGTRAAPVKEGPEPGPIYFQNHGNPVRFRNIWVQPLNHEKEARRPLIPGFERFHASDQTQAIASGQLLLGELNCLSCHSASDTLKTHVLTKTAPILTKAGNRLHADYVWNFIQDPHGVKPGTTMPSLLDRMPEPERKAAATAIASFLSTTGAFKNQSSNKGSIKNGERLFHEIGCIACHAPRNGTPTNPNTSVPLVGLGEKYALTGLEAFLKKPHDVRPSGRMPGFNLDDNQTRDLAHFLVGPIVIEAGEPNVKYSVFNKGFSEVPDLGTLTPDSTGFTSGLDISVANRAQDFSVRFEAYLKVDKTGQYRFHLGSDDGSFLYIDGEEVVDADGVHPHTTKTGRIKLTTGVHKIVVDYSEVGGEESLALEFEGPDVSRQPIDAWLTQNADGSPMKPTITKSENANASSDTYVFDGALVETGQKLFGSLGCAKCHELKRDGTPVEFAAQVPAIADCSPGKGCLAETKMDRVPDYELNRQQIDSINAVLTSATETTAAQPDETIVHAMKAFNCYGCHQRGSIGGPEADRNTQFISRIPEMGDEGRLPPPLNGVGDKLKETWLKDVLNNGAKNRPYMLTQMPAFGSAAGHLVNAFIEIDLAEPSKLAALDDADHRIKANGRKLVGSEGLSCIKCHTFGKYKSAGIQALDLQTMTKRINEDWFHRYLPKPEALRPGTRMPTAFPNGKSVATEIYDGDPGQQISAIWRYLSDADKAKVPDGVLGGMIELKPNTTPIIYRNFIEGLTPRGIAVGYPEGANIAWDADTMSLAMIWHGRFIDSSLHWEGRGQGRQQPLGDHAIKFDQTVPVAVLESASSPWPTESPKQLGYRFLGYRLDANGRPAFRYRSAEFEVNDKLTPVPQKPDAALQRTLNISAAASVSSLYVRAAVGRVITKQDDGSYLIDNAIRMRTQSSGLPVLRQSGDKSELLVPVSVTNGTAEVVQEISW